jgi:ABC-type transporter MlaC component
MLTKRAREATPKSKKEYFDTFKRIYSYPQQLVFVDETSKDGRDAMR